MPDIKTILSYIGMAALIFFAGFFIGKLVTDNAWKLQLAAQRPRVVIQHDTIPSKPISIKQRLNPVLGGKDTVGPAQLKLTESDSLCVYWGWKFIQFWGELGYWPEQAYELQDSLIRPRTLQYQDSTIGLIKLLYNPLPDFTATLEEARPARITSDTTTSLPPLVIPRGFFDYLVEFGGYGLAILIAVLALR